MTPTTETPDQPETIDMMGYEDQVGMTGTGENESPAKAPTSAPQDVQALINATVKEVTVDPKTGKYIYPEDIDPVLKAAVAATKSYRDNQSGFTKSQQSLKETEAEVTALREKLAKYTSKSLELSPEDRQTLDNLKATNPEAWREELNKLETQSKQAIQEELDASTEEARTKASGEYELERRYKYLEDFNKGRDTQITPEMLDTDVPPRITNKLGDGTLSFEEYLDEVAVFLNTAKTVATEPDTTTTDLNKVNGSTNPSESAQEKQGVLDYSGMTF